MSATKTAEALYVLTGLPLKSFGRAANLIWLGFGEPHEVSAFRGGTRWVHDWALHLQCAWRLCRRGRIEVADQDCYRDSKDEYLEAWDKPGKCRFDDYAAGFRKLCEAETILVQSVTVDDVGGFSLLLTEDFRLDVFPNNSGGDHAIEHWRLFEAATDRDHFVVFESPDDRCLDRK